MYNIMGSVLAIALQIKLIRDNNSEQREKNHIFEPHSSRKVIKKQQTTNGDYYMLSEDDG